MDAAYDELCQFGGRRELPREPAAHPPPNVGHELGLPRLGLDAALHECKDWTLGFLRLLILLLGCGHPGRLHRAVSSSQDQHRQVAVAHACPAHDLRAIGRHTEVF